jgi:hypothetical protein
MAAAGLIALIPFSINHINNKCAAQGLQLPDLGLL